MVVFFARPPFKSVVPLVLLTEPIEIIQGLKAVLDKKLYSKLRDCTDWDYGPLL